MEQSPSWDANRSQLAKNFPEFTESEGSLPHQKSPLPAIFLVRPIQSMVSYFTSWRSILILFSPLRLGFPSGLLPSSFPTAALYTPLLFPIRAMFPTHLNLLDLITRIIFGEEYRVLIFSLCSFLHFRYLVPLRPKYSPYHPILKQPQPTFLPQCDRPSSGR